MESTSEQEGERVAMVRLRRAGGEPTAGASWGGKAYLPDEQGIITVPSEAAGALTESHGFEMALDTDTEPTGPTGTGPTGGTGPTETAHREGEAIDHALDELSQGVDAAQHRIDELQADALKDVPADQRAEAREEMQHEKSSTETSEETGNATSAETTQSGTETQETSSHPRGRGYNPRR